MKRWVLRNRVEGQERCPECGLLGTAAVQAEQLVASIAMVRIWRHGVCGHLIMYRRAPEIVRDWPLAISVEELGVIVGAAKTRKWRSDAHANNEGKS